MVDLQIQYFLKRGCATDLDEGISFHGNRVLSALIFDRIGKSNLSNYNFKFEDINSHDHIKAYYDECFSKLRAFIENKHKVPVLTNVFKNVAKCKEMYESCKNGCVEDSFIGQLPLSF